MLTIIVHFVVEACAFTAILVAIFSKIRGGPKWLATYARYLLALSVYVSVRNVGYFFQLYVSPVPLEQSIGFFIAYSLSNSIFCAYALKTAFLLARSTLSRKAKAFIASAAIAPLLILVVGIAMRIIHLPIVLPAFFSISMYVAVFYYLYAQIYILIMSRKTPSTTIRLLFLTSNISGALYFVLAFINHYQLLYKYFYLDTFWSLNVSLLVIFILSITILAKRYLLLPQLSPEIILDIPEDIDDASRELIGYISKGYTNDEIATILGISTAGVKSRLYRLFKRFGAQSRSALLYSLKKKQTS